MPQRQSAKWPDKTESKILKIFVCLMRVLDFMPDLLPTHPGWPTYNQPHWLACEPPVCMKRRETAVTGNRIRRHLHSVRQAERKLPVFGGGCGGG